MLSLFSGLTNIEYLPDIFKCKWNTSKVTSLSNMFSECASLISIPNISKWDISNVQYINCLFAKCKFLDTLPDISLWNTRNVIKMNDIFHGCLSLIKLISKKSKIYFMDIALK